MSFIDHDSFTQSMEIQEENGSAFVQKGDKVTFYQGEKIQFENNTLEELEVAQKEYGGKIFFILPFCTAEREGVGVSHGNEEILAFKIEKEVTFTKEEILDILGDEVGITCSELETNISDETFRKLVEDVKDRIATGDLCQGVISRKFRSTIENMSPEVLSTIFKRLLGVEGGYMTYMARFGGTIFSGASPEVHLRVEDSKVHKSPIAGTIPKSPDEFYQKIVAFLKNKKEENELAMVTDEELKMFMKITQGGTITPTEVKEIGSVVHTYNEIDGTLREGVTPIQALKATLFSPTLVGGPIESAFSVIRSLETESRGYYGTAIGILGDTTLDTAIPIRTAEIDIKSGQMTVQAGAGVVKDSCPQSETDETRHKANGFLKILESENVQQRDKSLYELLSDTQKNHIESLLKKRAENMSQFYTENQEADLSIEEFKGKSIQIIHNGDDFTYMLKYMLERMGFKVNILVNDGNSELTQGDADILFLGPGYGDINDTNNPKMIKLLELAKQAQKNNKKVAGVCLGHQALSKVNGLEVQQQDTSTQGEQVEVEIFGKKQLLGCYNSYSPIGEAEDFDDSSIDSDGRVMYQQTGRTVSCQFHPESVMSINGFDILKNMMLKIV